MFTCPVGERIFNEFLESDKQLSPDKRAQLDDYLDRLTQYVSSTSPKKLERTNLSHATTSNDLEGFSPCQSASTDDQVASPPHDSEESPIEKDPQQLSSYRKRALSIMMVDHDLPEPKRPRITTENGPDSYEHKESMISPRSSSMMLQLTGQFSVAMDLWTDFPSPDIESINDNVLVDIIWGGVTDEEMNKFWDTLPKKYGGLM